MAELVLELERAQSPPSNLHCGVLHIGWHRRSPVCNWHVMEHLATVRGGGGLGDGGGGENRGGGGGGGVTCRKQSCTSDMPPRATVNATASTARLMVAVRACAAPKHVARPL